MEAERKKLGMKSGIPAAVAAAAVDAVEVEVCPAAGRCSEAAVVVAGNTHHCTPLTWTTSTYFNQHLHGSHGISLQI